MAGFMQPSNYLSASLFCDYCIFYFSSHIYHLSRVINQIIDLVRFGINMDLDKTLHNLVCNIIIVNIEQTKSFF